MDESVRMPAHPPLLEISHLGKTFGRVGALARVQLSIRSGECFALLGLNGAGKSTLLRCLLGLLRPTEGRVLFNGRPLTPADIHRHIGYLPERFQPPPELSAVELLGALRHAANSAPSPATVLEQVGLSDRRHQRIKTYSHGMVQRLGLAIALLKAPTVLIADEPFIGLDVAGQRQIIGLFQRLRDHGTTLLFSTHLFVHLGTCAQRIGILHQGRLQFAGTAEELCERHRARVLEDAFCKEVGLDEVAGMADMAEGRAGSP